MGRFHAKFVDLILSVVHAYEEVVVDLLEAYQADCCNEESC
jgi:hypothetical protein